MGTLGETLPKPLLPFGGQPLLAHLIRSLTQHNVTKVTVLAGHLADRIREQLPELAAHGLKLDLIEEPQPAGSGGCLRYLPPTEDTLLLIFADILVKMDYADLLAHHQRMGGCLTAVVHPNDHPQDSDLVEVGADGRVIALHRKPHPESLLVRNLACAGVFVLSPSALRHVPERGPADFVHDVLAPAVGRGESVFAYRTTEYLKDVGTPDRYAEASEDFVTGRLDAMVRSRPRPAAFLDRDGTINRDVGHLCRAQDLELLPGVAGAIRRLNHAGVFAVVVTNQPVVARGLCDERQLHRIHARLEFLLGAEGAFLDGVYYCPHHPDRGFAGEVLEYKVACRCRKPGAALIEAAARDLPIDLSRSVVIGDTLRDLGMAERAGLSAILLAANQNAPQGAELAQDLPEAVERWLSRTALAEPGLLPEPH